MIKTEIIKNVVRISFTRQELGAEAADALRGKLEDLGKTGSRRVIIDLTGVNFIASLVLGVLITELKNMRTLEGEIKLCSIRDNPRKVFEITRLDRAFDIFSSFDEALASYQNKPAQ